VVFGVFLVGVIFANTFSANGSELMASRQRPGAVPITRLNAASGSWPTSAASFPMFASVPRRFSAES
jgi:hypothetical protein